MNTFISFNCEVPEKQTSIRWSPDTIISSHSSDQRNFAEAGERKSQQHILKRLPQTPLIFRRVLLKFRPTSTLTEAGRHTNGLLYCSDDILSIKLWFEASKSELWWTLATESLLPKEHHCPWGTKLQDWRQGYNCSHRNELAALPKQTTAWFHPPKETKDEAIHHTVPQY